MSPQGSSVSAASCRRTLPRMLMRRRSSVVFPDQSCPSRTSAAAMIIVVIDICRLVSPNSVMMSMTGTSGRISSGCSSTRRCGCSGSSGSRVITQRMQHQRAQTSRSMSVAVAASSQENHSSSRRTALGQLLSVPLLATALLNPQSAQAIQPAPQVCAGVVMVVIYDSSHQ